MVGNVTADKETYLQLGHFHYAPEIKGGPTFYIPPFDAAVREMDRLLAIAELSAKGLLTVDTSDSTKPTEKAESHIEDPYELAVVNAIMFCPSFTA